MLRELRAYYERHGIGALTFRCQFHASCSSGTSAFTTAKESFVGPDYEKGTLPRLLFLSLDSGSANPAPSDRTLDAVRQQEMACDVAALPQGRHWYQTHELAWVLLRQFLPALTVADTSAYFAHVNSAKCCMNKEQRSQADAVLFENCRQFIPGELIILAPRVIVSQGEKAHRVMSGCRSLQVFRNDGDRVVLITLGSREALWIPTYHPTSRGGLYQAQKARSWSWYAEVVGRFVDGSLSGTPSSGSPQSSEGGNRPLPRPPAPSPSTGRPAAVRPVGALRRPVSIDELVELSRSITSPDTFDEFVAFMRRVLPGPRHPHEGILSGMRIQAFQNWQLDWNVKWRLTDAQLLAVMRVEFPQAVGRVFTRSLQVGLDVVQGIRRDYNRTGHNGPTPQSRGMPPSVSYGKI